MLFVNLVGRHSSAKTTYKTFAVYFGVCTKKLHNINLRRSSIFSWKSNTTHSIVSCSTRHLTAWLIYNNFVYTTQDFKVQCDHLYNLTGHCQPSDPKLSLYCLKIHTDYFHYFLQPFFCLWQICQKPPDISEFQSQLLWDQNSGQNVTNVLDYIPFEIVCWCATVKISGQITDDWKVQSSQKLFKLFSSGLAYLLHTFFILQREFFTD